MSIELGEFLPDLLLNVPGCSEPLAERAILLSAIRMAREALILQQDLDPIAVTSGFAEYDVESEISSTEVCEVITAKFNNIDLEPYGMVSVDSSRNVGAAATSSPGTPSGYLQYGSGIITLQPTPNADGELSLRIAYAPTLDATVIDDMYGTRYRDALLNGALSRLFGTAKQPFSDASMALFYLNSFNDFITRHRGLATIGFSRAPLRVIPQP